MAEGALPTSDAKRIFEGSSRRQRFDRLGRLIAAVSEAPTGEEPAPWGSDG